MRWVWCLWRHRFGQIPQLAFVNIASFIQRLSPRVIRLLSTPHQSTRDMHIQSNNWRIASSKCQIRNKDTEQKQKVCLSSVSGRPVFTVNVNVPLRDAGHPYRLTSAHSTNAFPSCCIMILLWPNYIQHAATITSRSDCLKITIRAWRRDPAWNQEDKDKYIQIPTVETLNPNHEIIMYMLKMYLYMKYIYLNIFNM